MKKSILIIDDNLTICLMLKSWLVKNNYIVETSSSAKDAKQMVKDNPFDMILCDIRMPDMDGITFLNWVKKYDSDILVIMMTGYIEIEYVVEAMKLGANDYISKPIDPDVLFSKIEEAFKIQDKLKSKNLFPNNFLLPPGRKYKQIYDQLCLVAENKVHVLIIGEIGTGKYSSVRFVYEKGIDPSKPLVIVDAAELIKSENETRKVDSLLMEKFLEANGGLLYISDIDRLNNIVQSELLNIFTKQNRDENFTQIILSSKISLDQLENILIPKFYSILQKNIVLLPALKGRSEQIISFAYHFLNFANFAFNKNIQGLDSEIQDLFSSYDWPGNIQELKNTILKAAMITEGDVISIDIADELFGTNKLEPGEKSRFNINSLKKENYEKEKIYKALVLAKGNKTMAASILNIDRKTLYNKIKLYNVKI